MFMALCSCCGQPGKPTRKFISDELGRIWHVDCYAHVYQPQPRMIQPVVWKRAQRRKAA